MCSLNNNEGYKIIKGTRQVELTGVFATLWIREIFVIVFVFHQPMLKENFGFFCFEYNKLKKWTPLKLLVSDDIEIVHFQIIHRKTNY